MLRVVAALLTACAVGMGAFGAHGLKQHFLDKPQAGGWWETATLYLLVHAIAVAALASASRVAGCCLLGGGVSVFGYVVCHGLGRSDLAGCHYPAGRHRIDSWVAGVGLGLV